MSASTFARVAGAAAACAAAFAPGMASAQTITDEVRCVLLSNALVGSTPDPRAKQIGTAVGAYFMGRLDTRPPAQVKSAIAAQKRRIVASEATVAMRACAARAGRAEAQLRALSK